MIPRGQYDIRVFPSSRVTPRRQYDVRIFPSSYVVSCCVSLNTVLEVIFGLLWCKDPKIKLPLGIAVEELWCAPSRFFGDLLDLIR